MGKTKKIIIVILSLAMAVESNKCLGQVMVPFDGKDYSKELYQELEHIQSNRNCANPFTFYDLFHLSEYCARRRKEAETREKFRQNIKCLLEDCFETKDNKVQITCSNVERVKDLLSCRQGNYIAKVSDLILSGDTVMIVYLITGSGVAKHTILVFQKAEFGRLVLLMGADFYNEDDRLPPSQYLSAGDSYVKMYFKEIEDVYRSRYRN